MHWMLLFIGTIIVVECFIRLPIGENAKRMLDTVGKISRTIRSPRISDHWKERVLPAYAGQLFKTSIGLFALVCLALLPMMAIGLAAHAAGLSFMAFMTTVTAILGSTFFAIVYVLIRKRLS